MVKQSLSMPSMRMGFFSSPFWASFVIWELVVYSCVLALHYIIMHLGIDWSKWYTMMWNDVLVYTPTKLKFRPKLFSTILEMYLFWCTCFALAILLPFAFVCTVYQLEYIHVLRLTFIQTKRYAHCLMMITIIAITTTEKIFMQSGIC